jgi:hypothetical protein
MRLDTSVVAALALGCMQSSGASAADSDVNSGSAVVAAFATFCLDRPGNVNEFAAQLDGDATLEKAEVPTDFLSMLKADFRRAWSYTLNQKRYQLILVHSPAWNSTDIRCALRLVEKGNILPYLEAFKDTLKAQGLKLREQNLLHYTRMSGKLPDGRNAEAILSSRGVVPAEPQRDNVTLTIRFAQ